MTEANDESHAVVDELRARITFYEEDIASWAEALKAAQAVSQSLARRRVGFAWFEIAACRVLLGEHQAAADGFAESARWQWWSLEGPPEASLATYSAALEAAVLSGDRMLMRSMAKRAPEPEGRASLVGDRRVWATALPALILGDRSRAADLASAFRSSAERDTWYPGLVDAIAALADDDARSLAEAVGLVLQKHRRYAQAKSSWCYNAGPCFLCVPATVLGRLAQLAGIAVPHLATRQVTVPLTTIFSGDRRVVRIAVDLMPGLQMGDR